ncbi:unnamed protein product [Malus baccata var. baccata]
MSQSANESERQSKKQKLVSPDPDPESLQGQGQIPDFPPNADELRKRGKLIWHWDDSDDDGFEDFPPGKVLYIPDIISLNFVYLTAKKELSEIRARRSSLKERKNTSCSTNLNACADSSTVVHDVRCRLCLREDHVVPICPYRYYVPKGEKVGPGGKLVCICCQKEGGHPGEEWVGKAVDSSTQVPDLSCRPCGKEGHANPTCTYQYYVPNGEQVGRGATLICRCCKKEGYHPGTNDWVGIAVPNYCEICGKRYAHRTEDCPRKQGMEMVTKRPLLAYE